MSNGDRARPAGRDVAVSHPDKELFGAARVTKRDLVEHYAAVAPLLLPHLRGRPLALHRFPDGIEREGFFQKRRPDHAPDWVEGARVERKGDSPITMVVCERRATLLWLANQATITLHPWLSRAGRPHTPDRLVVDVDPPDGDFPAARRAALDTHRLLGELELPAFVMTTGSRGLHVVVPIRPELDFDRVRELARGVVDRLAARHPDRLTTEVRKDKRHGRIFMDILRNAYAQHSVAPYSVRPLPDAPVATPVEWGELERLETAQAWNIGTIGERLDRDPWRGMARRAHSPRKALDRLAALAPR